MKPNWKDYLLGVAVILGIAAFIPAVIGILFAIKWFMESFPIVAAIICLVASGGTLSWALVSSVRGFAKANAEDRYFSKTVQTSKGRLTFPEIVKEFEQLTAISYDELDHLSTDERQALMELFRKNPERRIETNYWKGNTNVYWDHSYTFDEILYYLSQRFPNETEEHPNEA
jgi:hypothetical protein